MNKENVKRILRQYSFISLGVIVLNLGFYFFLQPIGLVTGGMLGLSVVLEPFLQSIGEWFTTSIFLYIVNIITLIIGGLLLGKDFFLKTIYASLFSPTIMFIIEKTIPNNSIILDTIVDNKMLITILLASITTGLGIGICVKNNACTGGMDVIQRILSKYLKIPMSKTMYYTDWVVVILSGFTFFGGFSFSIEPVIYGFVAVFVVSKIVDYIAMNAKPRRTAYIITSKPIEMRDMIYEKLNRGVTFTDVEGGYTGEPRKMIICALDKKEAYRLSEYIKEIDPQAFTFITQCKEIVGTYNNNKGIL